VLRWRPFLEKNRPDRCGTQPDVLYDADDTATDQGAGRRAVPRIIQGLRRLMAALQPSQPQTARPKTGVEPLPEKATMLGTLVHLWPYMWPGDRLDLKMRVVWSMVLLVAAKAATLVVPFTFKWATDALTGAGGTPAESSDWMLWLIASPVLLTLGYGGSRILMMVLTQWRDGLFAKVAMHAVRRLAYLTFVHMHELSLRFHLERKTGGLTRVLERGRVGIETIVRMVILQLAPTIVELALMVGVLLWQFDWRYVLVTLATVAVYMYYTYIATEWRIGIRRRMNESDTEANTKAIDSLLNYETVKYFGAEAREAQRYDRSMERYERASVETYTSLALLNTGQAVIFTCGLTATMVMCAIGVRNGTNTVGDFVMVNAMMIQLYQPLNFMGWVYREIKQAAIDIEKMFGVLARNPEVKDIPGAKPLAVTAGVVRFEDVHFSYDPERPILKGISFEVPAGKTVAIVGPSGAGKSTISRLLFRLYDVGDGRITIDGQNIRDVTQTSLRAAIGMVPQDTVLFNDTIRYNIRYGRWDATDAEVEEAAAMAQIDGFIRAAAHGYETEVGERGLKLSGGEKQRVAIARTILKGPPILVLDEATSALDSHTEREIQDALDKVSRNRTSLVIAHRLSTIVGADEIIVLDQGRIVERGTHAGLLAADGLYASMWNRQREAQEAREKLALMGDDAAAPNRLPPPVDDPLVAPAAAE
jgi:ATP-binding cassette subfamily B protein